MDDYFECALAGMMICILAPIVLAASIVCSPFWIIGKLALWSAEKIGPRLHSWK